MFDEREDEGPDGADAGGKPRAGGLTDMMSKAVLATVGAAFMTQESIRSYLAESKLPRDITKAVIQNTGQAKEQFFAYLAKEVGQIVKKADLPRAVAGFLSDHTIEIEARIRFKKDGGPEVTVGSAKAVPNPDAAERSGEAPSSGAGDAAPSERASSPG